jgi:RNase P subunit RPR2
MIECFARKVLLQILGLIKSKLTSDKSYVNDIARYAYYRLCVKAKERYCKKCIERLVEAFEERNRKMFAENIRDVACIKCGDPMYSSEGLTESYIDVCNDCKRVLEGQRRQGSRNEG